MIPAWWLAGRLQRDVVSPFFRCLVAVGLALVGYLTVVNLLGRVLERSIAAVVICLALNAMACAVLWTRRRAELDFSPLAATWRAWVGLVIVAVVVALPQWLVAVSTNYWDEAASSAIHLTAPNQFAEGVFPPRHNALPDVILKYHYGFTMLSGTVKWLTGFSAGTSVDIASTGLWLFVFLFVYCWLRQLGFGRFVGSWGGTAVLLGGGMGWLYLPKLETYSELYKLPPATLLLRRYQPAQGWLENLVANARVPSPHLRNADGSLSNIPWDIAAQFQQHAVALGIALTVFALYLFVSWRKEERIALPLLVANVITFSVLFLGHAVFGGVAAVTGGLCLLGAWLWKRTRVRFLCGLYFGLGLLALAPLHGGLLARGAVYGTSSDVLTLRHTIGYSLGGLGGFLHWNIVGFGLPLLLALVAWGLHFRRRAVEATERNLLFTTLTVFALFSYIVPQVAFYSSDTVSVEQFTEISKFFFTAHLALALLSAFGVAYLLGRVHWTLLVPAFPAMVIVPLAWCYANAFTPSHAFSGFYRAPYHPNSIEEQMARRLLALKKGPRDVYFDASADERKHGYLGEMFVFGGSVFTMTPSRFERTGVGYRLAESVVAERFAINSRLARLQPGSAEEAHVGWYYARPDEDLAYLPMIVRSRFAKLVAEGYFKLQLRGGARALYSIERPTADLDHGIERYWRPRIVSQMSTDLDGDGRNDLVYFDYEQGAFVSGERTIPLPDRYRGDFVQLFAARAPAGSKPVVLINRMEDTEFKLGKRIEDILEISAFAWRQLDAQGASWQAEFPRWYWNIDLPFNVDFKRDGFAGQVGYRFGTGQWQLSSGPIVTGPAAGSQSERALPFGGRFLEGSDGDLGLWSPVTGSLKLRGVKSGREVSVKWGGRDGDVFVPGDYTGDGYDEIAIWQRTNNTWYWRRAPDGTIGQATFGTATSVPAPWDYDHDGRIDLAYWEPVEGKIYVSFSVGKRVDLVVQVPPHSIPVFVQMY